MDGWFEAEEVTCYARAAREQWERSQPDGKQTEPGTLLLVNDTRQSS